ncbi:YciI family protein [Actinoplanes nipponensis]|nr:YciI family protein [Actinoplanes nipponensis]
MISTYLAPLDEVDQARTDHLAFIDGLERAGVLVSAGRQDPPVGGILLLNVDTEARAHELLADDPYVRRGLAEYAATGWQPTRGVLADWKSPAA